MKEWTGHFHIIEDHSDPTSAADSAAEPAAVTAFWQLLGSSSGDAPIAVVPVLSDADAEVPPAKLYEYTDSSWQLAQEGHQFDSRLLHSAGAFLLECGSSSSKCSEAYLWTGTECAAAVRGAARKAAVDKWGKGDAALTLIEPIVGQPPVKVALFGQRFTQVMIVYCYIFCNDLRYQL
jgi:hypothetical protein